MVIHKNEMPSVNSAATLGHQKGAAFLEASKKRLESSNSLLEYMHTELPYIELDYACLKHGYVNFYEQIENRCKLKGFLKDSILDLDELIPSEIKNHQHIRSLANLIAALDFLADQGLVSKNSLFVGGKGTKRKVLNEEHKDLRYNGIWGFDPFYSATLLYFNFNDGEHAKFVENKVKEKTSEIEKDSVKKRYRGWLEFELDKTEELFTYHILNYTITKTGHDKIITAKTSSATVSSAKTAKYAICAAIFIAIGSIGNLLIPVDLPPQCKTPIVLILLLLGVFLSCFFVMHKNTKL